MIQFVFLKKVLLGLVILCSIDAVIGTLSAQFFPVGFFADKSIGRIVSDLAFVEGAAVLFAGALLAFFYSKISLRTASLILIGAAMIGMSVAFGVLG